MTESWKPCDWESKFSSWWAWIITWNLEFFLQCCFGAGDPKPLIAKNFPTAIWKHAVQNITQYSCWQASVLPNSPISSGGGYFWPTKLFVHFLSIGTFTGKFNLMLFEPSLWQFWKSVCLEQKQWFASLKCITNTHRLLSTCSKYFRK